MELLKELPRDLDSNEIIGRELFLKITKEFPEIHLAEDKNHEDVLWSCYSIRVPLSLFKFFPSEGGINVTSPNKYITLNIHLEHQDPNYCTLPLEARDILNVFRDCLQRDDEV